MLEWDPGPPPAFADHFERHPSYRPWKARFRMAWGPIFYRGRLDGSARVLVIGQDPAADEDIARRILVGSAGQQVQGYLRKLGLVRSYVMVNSFLYGLRGQIDAQARQILAAPSIRTWRNQLVDMLATPQIEAILAFGAGAHGVIELWPNGSQYFVARLTHPSARDEAALLRNWNEWLPQLRQRVRPDLDGSPSDELYGMRFRKRDLASISASDLPFGVPKWLGNGDTAERVKGRDGITWKPTAAEG